MSNLYDKIKDTSYCYFAMHSFSVHAHGRSRMCCVSRDHSNTYLQGNKDTISLNDILKDKPHQIANDLDSYINDKNLMQIRAEMLKGHRPESCQRCWNLEENGIKSFRQIQNTTYEKFINKDLSHIDQNGRMHLSGIKYLDITLGNVCNLKCRSCNPWNSHRWIEEGPHVPHANWGADTFATGRLSSENPWFHKAFDEGLFDTVLPNVNAINFLGGEPLVVQEHYDWLEKIIDKGYSQNINLFYNTNGTTLPKRLFDIWEKFQTVSLGLSIDAIGELSYYVRHPTKWNVIENNIKKLAEHSKTHKNIYVQTHVTLSVLNLHDLPNILEWCKKNYDQWHYQFLKGDRYWGNYGYQNCVPHFNVVEYPSWLHIRHLPQEIKNELGSMIDQQIELLNSWDLKNWEKVSIKNIEGIKSTMNLERDEAEWNKFIENTKASDKFRNLNIVDYLDWMKDYI